MLPAQRISSILALFGLFASIWYATLLARADLAVSKNTLDDLRKAVGLVPGNAAYHALLGEHLEAAGLNPDRELELATELSPRESRYWLRRGFRAEVEQKYADAESYLIDSNRVDRGFDPRSALANFYFRRGRFPEFRKAVREALDISYGNLDPIFRLCMAADDDPAVTRAILPPRPNIRFAFFSYLVRRGQFQPAAPLASEAVADAAPEDVPILIEYVNRQIGHDGPSSLKTWNAMCHRRLLPFTELSPDSGQCVTNSDFAITPTQQGFDWKSSTDSHIIISAADLPGGISVQMIGTQADHLPLLEQPLPLTPGKQYTVTYDYRLAGGAGLSGLQWVIQGAGGDGPENEPIAVSPVLSGTDWQNGHVTFSARQRNSAALKLEYRRVPGTLPWKGTLEIRRVSSSLARTGLDQ